MGVRVVPAGRDPRLRQRQPGAGLLPGHAGEGPPRAHGLRRPAALPTARRPSEVTSEAGGYVGRPMGRREDERLLTGAGLFVADVHLPREMHLAVLRSPYAHARIERIDVGGAR